MQKNTKKEVYSWIKSIVLAFMIAFIFRHFLFSPFTVLGESMTPTFQDHDRILVNKTSEIQRFDMIVFQAPDADDRYIKRVIGVPGDDVEVKDDMLYINGREYDEPYLKKEEILFGNFTGDFTLEELTGEGKVPNDYFFVLGDNRLNSKDSRIFGFIPENSVIGKVQLRYYPFEEIGIPK